MHAAFASMVKEKQVAAALAPAVTMATYNVHRTREREEEAVLERLEGSRAWKVRMIAHAVQTGYEHHRTLSSGWDYEFDHFLATLATKWAQDTPAARRCPRAYILFHQREMMEVHQVIEEMFPSQVTDGRRIFRLGLAGPALTYCTQYPPPTRLCVPENAVAKTALRVRFEEPEDAYFRACAHGLLREFESRAHRKPLLFPHEVPPLPGMDAVATACFRAIVGLIGPGLTTLHDPTYYWARTGIRPVALPRLRPACAAAREELRHMIGRDGMRMVRWAERAVRRYAAFRRAVEARAENVVPSVVAENLRWAGDLATAAAMVEAAFSAYPVGPTPTIGFEREGTARALDILWHARYGAAVCAALCGDAAGAADYYERAHRDFARRYRPDTPLYLAFVAEQICICAHYAPAFMRVGDLVLQFRAHASPRVAERVHPLLDSAMRRAAQNEDHCLAETRRRVADRFARHCALARANSIRKRRAAPAVSSGERGEGKSAERG